MSGLYLNSKQIKTEKSYDLTNPSERLEYFHSKLGSEIEELKSYLEKGTFLCFLLAKKGAGKGTYAKMFQEVFGESKAGHLSVGDLVRDIHSLLQNDEKGKEIREYLTKNYRGFVPVDKELEAFLDYTQAKLISTEFILTLVKMELERMGPKAIFLDGLPRNLDQISYSLYLRNLFNFSSDPDFFVLLEAPESLLDERVSNRRVCPLCNTSKNYKLNPSKFVHAEDDGTFSLLCDNGSCSGYSKERLVLKSGDAQGLESVRDRMTADAELMDRAKQLVGVPVIRIPGSIPTGMADEYFDEYELNPEFIYATRDGEVVVTQKPWVVKSDSGEDHNVLMAATVVLTLIKRIHEVLI